MLIPGTGSKQIVASQDQDQTTTKTTSGSASEKPAGVGSIADSLEMAKSKTDQGFSEIYQSAKQTCDNGQKELSPEQQQQVSNFDLQEIVDRPSAFAQDSRSKYEDGKNSGLTAPFSSSSSAADQAKDRLADKTLTQEEIFHLNTAARSSEKTGDAVSDILPGGNLRDAANEALEERHEEINVITGGDGSPKERLRNLMGSMTPEPEKSGPAYDKGMISQSLGIDPTPAEVEAAKKAAREAEKEAAEPVKAPEPSTADKALKIVKDVLVYFALTKTPVPAPPMEKDEYENTGKGVGALLNSKDRTPESEARKGGGGLRSYTYEDYQRNIPEEIKKQMDYDLGKLRALHQDPGGEEVQDDPNAIGGSKIDDGRLHLSELGIRGLVGQPGEAVDQHTGPGSSTQPGGASGGDIDWENGTGFSGTTHQDDPGNVQFGPSAPIAGPVGSDSKEEEEDTTPRKKDPLIGIR